MTQPWVTTGPYDSAVSTKTHSCNQVAPIGWWLKNTTQPDAQLLSFIQAMNLQNKVQQLWHDTSSDWTRTGPHQWFNYWQPQLFILLFYYPGEEFTGEAQAQWGLQSVQWTTSSVLSPFIWVRRYSHTDKGGGEKMEDTSVTTKSQSSQISVTEYLVEAGHRAQDQLACGDGAAAWRRSRGIWINPSMKTCSVGSVNVMLCVSVGQHLFC